MLGKEQLFPMIDDLYKVHSAISTVRQQTLSTPSNNGMFLLMDEAIKRTNAVLNGLLVEYHRLEKADEQ